MFIRRLNNRNSEHLVKISYEDNITSTKNLPSLHLQNSLMKIGNKPIFTTNHGLSRGYTTSGN